MVCRHKVVQLVCILLLVAAFIAFANAARIVKGITTTILSKAFVASKVSIGECRFSWGTITYKDIVVSGGQIDQLTISRLTVRFTLRSLAALTAGEVFLEKADFSVQSGSVLTKGISSRFDPLTRKGMVGFEQCSLGKLVLSDMQGEFYLEKQGNLVLHRASARILQGNVQFHALVDFEKIISYSVGGSIQGVSLQEIERAFELEKKVHLEGFFSGTFIVDGIGPRIVGLTGELASHEPGGAIALYDDTMIKNIAQASRQPIEIIAEGFRDYQYATGTVSMRTETLGIIVRLLLEGVAGKRDLTIVLHGDSPGKVGL